MHSPPKAAYGPTAVMSVGPSCGAPGVRVSKISSRPSDTRVGTPPDCAYGSGWIQLLYQDWMPGPKPSAESCASVDPLAGLRNCGRSTYFVHDLPKSPVT